MRVLVVTVVHTPLDARIHGRQITALREAGHAVTYVAPFTGHGAAPSDVQPGVVTFDVPRASGRDRAAAWRQVRRRVADLAPRHDVVLLHDPELLAALAGLRALRGRVVVWDVHEDTAGALVDKTWLPPALAPMAAAGVRAAERWAQRNLRLLLAEERYLDRFPPGPDGRQPPVVPNTPMVPDVPAPGPTDPPRVVHVGRLSVLRGVHDLLAAGRLLAGEVEVHLVGTPDREVADVVRAAHRAGDVVFHGFVPNEQALAMAEGAVAGLSLLHDVPNYRQSMPTKVWEYLGRAVPVVTTPLPRAAELVEQTGAGVVVPFGDPAAVAEAIRALRAESAQARAAAVRAHAQVRERHAWNQDGPRFVAQLAAWHGESG